ncbi:hypothetical protein [Allorhodopirellula solitaria]|uniref:Uncharacterized protein n=1 Tax=Allorhodopirellula solitaria TaxID=2527987 RepID=A0A5C5XRX7_9BACT|nr:hypothetical protein [Allorhodopirellula solitaria]TWT64785.1 hypothetical protein CA85_35700 [Allorhodopirellula solitaria]
MIDRSARNDLAGLIRRYLGEQIKAFDFDEALDPFRDSEDSAIEYVANAMWYHYDDCDDHLIVASKQQWDYLQRLLLLLESNSTVSHEHRREWSVTQWCAAFLLAACIGIAVRFGVGSHLFIFFVPFGLASIALSHFRRANVERGPYDEIVTPFVTMGDLRVAYDSAGHFKKSQFPRHIDARLVRSPAVAAFWTCHMYVMWAILAPAPLLVQCAPVRLDYSVVTPG